MDGLSCNREVLAAVFSVGRECGAEHIGYYRVCPSDCLLDQSPEGCGSAQPQATLCLGLCGSALESFWPLQWRCEVHLLHQQFRSCTQNLRSVWPKIGLCLKASTKLDVAAQCHSKGVPEAFCNADHPHGEQ